MTDVPAVMPVTRPRLPMAVDTLALALLDDQVASSVRFEVLLSSNTPVAVS